MCIGLPEDEDSTAEEENRPREEKNERRTRGMGGLKKEIKVKQKKIAVFTYSICLVPFHQERRKTE